MLELNRLYHMDCMEGMRHFPDKFFDLAIVDPPYRDAADNAPTKDMRQKRGDMNSWCDKPDERYFRELFRVSKNQIIWGGNNFVLPGTNCVLFWYKRNPLPNYSDGELAWTSFSGVTRCIDLPYYGTLNADEFKIHPTQKPVKLYGWILKNFAKPGDRILDTHVGSASSLVACSKYGFDYIGFEIDEGYYKAAQTRLADHKAQVTIFDMEGWD